jgi:hypothetical protein
MQLISLLCVGFDVRRLSLASLMAASAPERNILDQAASIRNRLGAAASRAGPVLPARERLRHPKACIPRQWAYLESVMMKLVRNLRLFAHAGCLKAGT